MCGFFIDGGKGGEGGLTFAVVIGRDGTDLNAWWMERVPEVPEPTQAGGWSRGEDEGRSVTREGVHVGCGRYDMKGY